VNIRSEPIRSIPFDNEDAKQRDLHLKSRQVEFSHTVAALFVHAPVWVGGIWIAIDWMMAKGSIEPLTRESLVRQWKLDGCFVNCIPALYSKTGSRSRGQ